MPLDGGRAPGGGTRVRDRSLVAAMQRPERPMPASASREAQMRLGWMLDDWRGTRVIGHGGGAPDQLSFLGVLPDCRPAVWLW